MGQVLQPGDQRLAIPRPAVAAAERIDQHLGAGDAEIGQQVIQQPQHLGVGGRIVASDQLGADLRELP